MILFNYYIKTKMKKWIITAISAMLLSTTFAQQAKDVRKDEMRVTVTTAERRKETCGKWKRKKEN